MKSLISWSRLKTNSDQCVYYGRIANYEIGIGICSQRGIGWNFIIRNIREQRNVVITSKYYKSLKKAKQAASLMILVQLLKKIDKNIINNNGKHYTFY